MDEEDIPHPEDAPDPQVQRLKDPDGVHTTAWSQILEEMEELAAGRRADGWDVLTLVAAHTDAITKDMREHDRFGIQHIIPDNHADEFVEFYEEGALTEFLVYGRDIERFMYLVTEYIDPENERIVMVAGRYDMTLAGGLITNAQEEGHLNSYLRRINGTIEFTFEHEEWQPLISSPEQMG